MESARQPGAEHLVFRSHYILKGKKHAADLRVWNVPIRVSASAAFGARRAMILTNLDKRLENFEDMDFRGNSRI
jgi:hypothetical protein